MYGKGQGVAQDDGEAVRWYRLAAKQGDMRAVLAQGQLERIMTPDELTEAQRLAREWNPRGN